MKQIKKYLKLCLFSLMGLSLLTSCKKSFLEIEPKGKLIAATTSDYDLLLNNLDLMNMFANPQVLMSDEIASNEVYFNVAPIRSQRLFRWDKDIYEVSEDASEFTGPVKALYTYNKIINEVSSSIDGTEEKKDAVLGEALAGRAWVNFLLINLYGKPYQATTASSDPGFPLITEANVVVDTYTRASVQQVYDAIVKDLTTAIPLLPKIVFRSRMSKSAAEAILGKVYLFMRKPAEALPLFNSAFIDLSSALVNVRLYDYNVTMGIGGSFLPISTTSGPAYPIFQNNQESLFARQFGNNWTGSNNLAVLKKEIVDLYKPSDLRLKFFSATAYSVGTAFPNNMLRRLGPSNTQFGMVLPDLYLLRAECKARLNDRAGAVADVEVLRANRMPSSSGDVEVPAADKADQLSLLNYIMNERIREFALTGYRWFDIRRLSVDPLFPVTTYTHTLFLTNGSTTTFTLKPERFTLRLPLKVISYNPDMVENP